MAVIPFDATRQRGHFDISLMSWGPDIVKWEAVLGFFFGSGRCGWVAVRSKNKNRAIVARRVAVAGWQWYHSIHGDSENHFCSHFGPFYRIF
jgi:hypothetical protein